MFNIKCFQLLGLTLHKHGTIFTHLKLWVALARHNFKWVKIEIIHFSVLRVTVGQFSQHGVSIHWAIYRTVVARECFRVLVLVLGNLGNTGSHILMQRNSS